MISNIAEQLTSILSKIQISKDSSFAGIGIVVCSSETNIPMISLRPANEEISKLISSNDLFQSLMELSNEKSDYHDGFHILNTDLQLIKISQFIAPPIIDAKSIGHHGSRYITALLTSKISGVLATGVIGKSYPPKVFVDGIEYNHIDD